MPGQQRRKLKLVVELLRRVEATGSALYDLMPAQYQEHPDSDDPTCVAWRRAGQAAVENYRALDALRAQLADKVARAEQRKAITEPDRR